MQSSVGRDKSALVRVDLATGKTTVLGASDQADVETVWLDPRTLAPQAYTVNYLKPEVVVLNKAMQKDVALLNKELGDGYTVTNRTLDDSMWTVVSDDALAPASQPIYTTARPARSPSSSTSARRLRRRRWCRCSRSRSRRATASRSSPICRCRRARIRTATAFPRIPCRMVLNVHGGPWGRDTYGFDNEHQWLANRGYAVLSVNYRGSTGFGKSFVNAGNKEWAGKMHDDLLDAVDWAVEQKITTTDKVAIYGGSYGGYATLVGLTFTPDTFACGVDIVGPSNLATLLSVHPAVLEVVLRRVRDARRRSAHGRGQEAARRALAAVARRRDQEAAADRAGRQRSAREAGRGRPDREVDEGQEPARDLRAVSRTKATASREPANRTSFYAITEGFLASASAAAISPSAMTSKARA